MRFKNILIQLLGVFSTLLSVSVIYLILFKDGQLREISAAMLIEFAIVIVLAISTKFFWYTSTESSIRTGKQYLEKRTVVSSAIEETITDAKNFDDFIEVENDSNYNKYVSNYCKNITVNNYKMTFFDRIHQLVKHKPKSWYMIRYMLKIEHKASRQHKLSGANIRSMTQSVIGLTDDRNYANHKKITFLWTGAVFSVITMFFTAAIAFEDKTDIDIQYAILKMVMYVSQILFSILQAILKARMTVSNEDLAYFNKVISILEKYETYKKQPYVVEKISYIPKEVNEIGNEQSKINVDSSV